MFFNSLILMPVSFLNFVLYHFFVFQDLFFRHFFISMKVVDHQSRVAPEEISVHRNRHVYPRPAKNSIKSFLENLMYFITQTHLNIESFFLFSYTFFHKQFRKTLT